jgi:uncharacterized protein
MKTRILLILSTSLILFFCAQPSLSQGVVHADNENEHNEKVVEWRKQKDVNYKIKEKTMLTDELLEDFDGLNYYDVDYSFRVEGQLTKFTDGRTFAIQTTGGQVYDYLIYGQVTFELNGKSLTLNVYQGQRSAKSGEKKGALFIPFTDNTSTNETYGGGRYLVLDLPDNDTLVLDFNMAYNPYCLYNPDHSCPLPPRENNLEVSVEAGELMYP